MTAPFDTWMLLLAAIGATYIWRALAVPLSSRIDADGAVFGWVTCVTYALLAGLIARMIVLPLGDLASTPISDRLVAVAVALIAFFLGKRNVLIGIAAGTAVFISLTSYVEIL